MFFLAHGLLSYKGHNATFQMDFTLDTLGLTVGRIHGALEVLCASQPRFAQVTRVSIARAIAQAGGLHRCISHIRHAANAINSTTTKTKALSFGDSAPPKTNPKDSILTPVQIAAITRFLNGIGLKTDFLRKKTFALYNDLSRYPEAGDTQTYILDSSYLAFVFLMTSLINIFLITILINHDIDRGTLVMKELHKRLYGIKQAWQVTAPDVPLVEEIHQQLGAPAPSAPPRPFSSALRGPPKASAPPDPHAASYIHVYKCATKLCRNDIVADGDTKTMEDPITFDDLDARSMRVSSQGWCYNKQTILDMQEATDKNKHIDPFTRLPTEYFSVQNSDCKLVPDDELNPYPPE